MGIKQILLDKYYDYLSGIQIYETKTSLKLSKIVVNKESRDSGIGTKIMQDLVNYADTNKQIIALTPSSDFGGNKNRLIQFYKKFGFKLNQGYNKNYEFNDTMIRYPKTAGMRENMKIQIKKLLREGLLKEEAIGKHLIVVDIQPEYENYLDGLQHKLFSYININITKISRLTFLYNGEDTLGMVSESDYRMWLTDNGLDEDIAYNVDLYDKGYAFFRYCMDSNIEHNSIVNLVKFMSDNDINDSRDLDKTFWDRFIEEYGNNDVKDLLENADDCINIPDLMDYLNNFNNIVLVGGGENECLKEVEIALDALGKNYQTWGEYVYENKKQHKTILRERLLTKTDLDVYDVTDFVNFAKKFLGIDDDIKIALAYERTPDLTTTAYYNLDGFIKIYVKDRAIMDVCRSIAHELVHHKQNLDGRLVNAKNDGEDGSPIENEANSVAGIIIRKWGKIHPEMYL